MPSLDTAAKPLVSGSRLERVLRSGQFAVTAEIGPPPGCDPSVVTAKGDLLRSYADALNITDNQTAVVRLSSIAAAVLLMQRGIEPVMQMTCRDRNRIAIQSDVLGAASFGIRNCLCIAGDHQSFGAAGKLKGHPGAKNVYDVDSIQLVAMLKKMRDEGLLEGGDAIEHGGPQLFIGAAWTPVTEVGDIRVLRLAKKVAAGADFIQTQGVYDIEEFKGIMSRVRDRGLHHSDPHPRRRDRAQERGDAPLHAVLGGGREGPRCADPADGRRQEGQGPRGRQEDFGRVDSATPRDRGRERRAHPGDRVGGSRAGYREGGRTLPQAGGRAGACPPGP